MADLSEKTTLITERRPGQALLDRAAEVGATVIVTSELAADSAQ